MDKAERDRFYNSGAWRKLRLKILERDHFECLHCKAKGMVVTDKDTTLIVDHIVELKDDPSLALEPTNLRTLCFKCHEKRHNRFFKEKRTPVRFDDEWY